MKFIVKRDILLKSLNFVQGVVEKKNTLPILSNVLLQLKDKKLSIVERSSPISAPSEFMVWSRNISKKCRALSSSGS